jgi:hypothetical protein
LVGVVGASSFNSSRLVGFLSGLQPGAPSAAAPAGKATPTLAEQLGAWMGWTDAIALSSVLNAPGPAAVAPVPAALAATATQAQQAAWRTLAPALARLRSELAAAVAADPVLAPSLASPKPARAAPAGRGGPPARASAPALTVAEAADPALYRRSYLAHQRTMALRAEPLRAQVRAAMARLSPALAQLATLDATLEKALAARERQCLASVPVLLERFFDRQRQAAAPLDEAATTLPDWLAQYRQLVQAVLLAEWEVRLLPTEGLIEALRAG